MRGRRPGSGILFVAAAVLSAAMLAAGPASSAGKTPVVGETVLYTTFDGAALELHPWVGRNVALLTPGGDYDAATMASLLAGLDAAYDFYAAMVGDRPTLDREVAGRLAIAVVPET
ncbi:MAG: hypothetical protein AB7O56_03160 [Bauldia sp.]